jgi:Zn-dependent protease/predicted transcriptional regulator
LLGWVGLQHYRARHNPADAVGGLLFISALFGIIVLHELGHALTARRFGIRTRDITLLPIGGVARLERMPDNPKEELLVALAGPAVNIALALLLLVLLIPATAWEALGDVRLVGGHLLVKLMLVNVVLAVFNLVPAFPMDGGRVLRALLALKMDYVRATNIAATVGQGLALVFGFIGLFRDPFLVFIALFVWMGAASEASIVQVKSALGGIPIERAMITDFRTLAPSDSLQRAVEFILGGFQQDFPVLFEGRLVGVLTRADMLAALAQQGRDAPVSRAMRDRFEIADPAEMLDSVLPRLRACDCHTIPVLRAGQLVGMLTMDNIGEFLMIQSALRHTAPPKLAVAGLDAG